MNNRLTQRWSRLPREARDTLFLLAVIAWSVLPHAPHLPGWCLGLTGLVLFWRASLALRNAALPGRWVLIVVLVVAAALTLITFRTLLGKEAGVTMVVVLMALKTLELRARRDAFVVFFLGFFLILTQFLYSQSLLVAFAMLVSVWGLLTGLVLAHMPVGQPSLRQAGSLAARTALFGAPLMVLMFLLFPRIGPLWGVPHDGEGRTGLSNSMRMGSVAELAQDDSIALRLRFDSTPPAPSQLYLRGPVLTRFDGVDWLPETVARGPAADLQGRGPALSYEMTLEPQPMSTLPLIEAPASAPQLDGMHVLGSSDLQWRVDRPVYDRLRLRAQAWTTYRYGIEATGDELDAARALPEGFNPRMHAWADAQRAAAPAGMDPQQMARMLLTQIRQGNFRYTLSPGTYGRNAVDEFWFDRRAGFCEHYAAAFVVAMRSLGIPARIVTGYQGSDPQPIDGYYVVRQSAAHAWAEYWVAGQGWIHVDPTAAVAPDRIEHSRRLTAPRGLVAGAIAGVSPQFLTRLRDNWEAIDNRWNQWVLNYTRGTQLDALQRLGVEAPDAQDLLLILIGALSTLALLGAGWAWWDRRRVDPWQRQRQRMLAALGELGIDAAPHDPPGVLMQRVRQRFGDDAQAVCALLDQWEKQRYGRTARTRPDNPLTRQFVAQVRALRGRATTLAR